MAVAPGLSIGAKSLAAYQTAMQIIGHNIANATTPGYSRQRASFETSRPDIFTFGSVGTGVDIADVRRVRDAYLDVQLNRENGTYGQWCMRDDALKQLELYFNESSESSVSNVMASFWESWQSLCDGPEDQISRVSLVQQSLLLCNTMNSLSVKIDDLRSSLDETIESKVSQVNSISSQVASLNSQIVSFEAAGKMASDLRDKRDYLLSQLSRIVNFTCNELSDGSYSIDVGGKLLVWNTEYTSLGTQADEDDPLYLKDVVWQDTLTEVAVTSGELGGLLYVRDTVIPGYQDKVDSLVNGLVKQINSYHSRGWGLNGYSSLTAGNAVVDADVAMGSSASGLAFYSDIADGTVAFNAIDAAGEVVTFEVAVTGDMTLTEFAAAVNTHADNLGYVSASVNGGLFSLAAGAGYTFTVTDDSSNASNLLMALGINTFFTGSGAADVSVAQVVQDNPDKIAAAQSFNPGDNANALAIAALKDTRLMQNATLTFDSFYQTGIIGNLGVAITEASQMKDNQELIVEQLNDSIAQVSGVSLDEEMTVLMQYQHAYEASAKYLTIISEMLDSLMNVV